MLAVLTLPAQGAEPSSKVGALPTLPGVAFEPLPERPPTDSPRFVTLPPERTGVTAVNRYDDPRMWADRYEVFAYGSLGTGVAIGDYDRDGWPDLFVACKTGPGRLYRNLGDWRFADVTSAAGLLDESKAWQHGVAWADLNGDGWLDLYLCRHDAPNQLYLNQRDGTFRENAAAAGLALNDASVMAAIADYDRDGRLDVYVQTNLRDHVGAPRGQRDRLFRNRGDGTFEDRTDAAGIFGETQGHSATWWDYNHDGWPDLYVANDFVTPDQLYHNRGDGRFLNVLDYAVDHFPHFAMGADLGDVNNDGRLDLFVVDMLPTRREQRVRGLLNMQATMARDLPPNAAAQYLRNALYLDAGAGYLQEAAHLAGLAATDWSWSARFEDLDEDARIDLHVTNGMVRDFLDGDLIARISNLPIAQRREVVRASPPLRERNFAFRNAGGLSFEDVGAAWGLDHEGISFGVAFGDLDRDGDLDLVFANLDAPPTLCRNDTAGTHRALVALAGAGANRFAIGAVVRVETTAALQVRQLSVARGYASSSEPLLHFGLGAETRIRRLVVQWPGGGEQEFTDLPADCRITITEPAQRPAELETRARPERPQFQEVAAELGLQLTPREAPVDEFSAQPLLPWRMQTLGPGLAVGDVDGDEVDDLVVGGLAGWPAQVWLRAGRGFEPATSLPPPARPVADAAPLILEADAAGGADLLLPAGGVNQPSVETGYTTRLVLGQGLGLWRAARAEALPNPGASVGPAVAADWNRDGRSDVFLGGRVVPGAYGATPRSALWVNRGGRFEDVTEAVAPGLRDAGMLNAAVWADVDDDGWPDLVVAGEWTGVRCWRNEAGVRFTEISERIGFGAAGRGWWHSVVAADFNADGRIDFALGNQGLNTRYQASVEAPLVLLRGVFEPGRSSQLVEAETIAGRLFPIRARGPFASVLPRAGRRAPTHAAYAAADLDRLLTPEVITAAQRLEVTELRSGILLSGAHGYTWCPLPREAQIAPVFGLAATDFDGDGATDLLVVNNTHAPNPETGRFAGGVGLLLRGDDRGGFVPVDPAGSGIVVPGEARGLATLDLENDGWPDVVVARRDAPLLVYRNRGVAGRGSFAVRLAGVSSASARVTVRTVGGRHMHAQWSQGGGWLSQSAPLVFFGYAESDLPAEIVVRWSDGTTTRQPWRRTAVIAGPAPGAR